MITTIENMHYDFKMKLNKIDSQKYRNLQVQEIDWKLNEAQWLLIKTITEPRIQNKYGFETNRRTIDDIRTLVRNDSPLVLNQTTNDSYTASLPNDYMFYASAYVIADKGNCKDKRLRFITRQHNDKFQESPFDESSFEWREINGRFYDSGIKVFAVDFTPKTIVLDYIRKPLYMHYANGTINGTYNLPDGTILTGKQDSELPEHMISEIVDLAVLITTGDLQIPDYNIKLNKFNSNN